MRRAAIAADHSFVLSALSQYRSCYDENALQMSYTTVATQLIERDYRLLLGLFESRVMTISHAASLYFSGSLDAARKRVWKLKNARLVTERTRNRPYDPSILYLTRQGFERLSATNRLTDYPAIGWPTMEKRTNVSPLTLQHELDVMTTKAAIVSAIVGTDTYSITEFSTWPRLFAFPVGRGTTTHGLTKPDAFIRIREIDADGFHDTEHRFYLELDRSTESLSRLQAKAGAYVEHYRSGGLARRFGAASENYAQFPFRVLIVCPTAERRNNIARAMLHRHPPILTMVWVTTLEELRRDPLGAIWIRPIDLRDATQGTSFDASPSTSTDLYRRESARESFIERRVTKHAILGGPGGSTPAIKKTDS